MLEKLQSIGYEYDEVVELPGTFGKRGGIVDIFPVGREQPVRLEFFGDEIDSVREYDARTQRSSSLLAAISISPAREMSSESDANILDYLPPGAVVILDDPSQIEAEIERIEEQAVGMKSQEDNAGNHTLQLPYFGWKQIAEKFKDSGRIIELSEWDSEDQPAGNLQVPIAHAPNFAARFAALLTACPN